MTKMNPEIKQQWVQALRSGEYEQGFGALNRNGKFCCLGVLADLAVKAGVTEWQLHSVTPEDERGIGDPEEPGGINTSSLTSSVREWSGVGGLQAGSLIDMNDIQGTAFPEIAHYIEENL